MTAATPLDPRNLSLLWASPERADEIAALADYVKRISEAFEEP